MKKSLLSFVTLAAIAVSSFLFSDNSLANAQILAEIDSDDEVSCFNEFVIDSSNLPPIVYSYRCSDCKSYPILSGSDPSHCVPASESEIEL